MPRARPCGCASRVYWAESEKNKVAEAIRVPTPRDKCNDAFGSGHAAPPRGSLGEIMRTKIQRLVLLVMLVGGLLVALSTPANAATNQISGIAVYDTTPRCLPTPSGRV